jgi:6-phosphogluconolactonase (cycloisomerase 2 family)
MQYLKVGFGRRPPMALHHRLLATLFAAVAATLALAGPAGAARTAYFADRGADAIVQYSVVTGGGLGPLTPISVPAADPRRLAMTSTGTDLYASAGAGILQYDVATDGRLVPKPAPILWAGGDLGAIAVHPDDASVYVADAYWDKVRQFDVGPTGQLTEKDPFSVPAGPGTTGLAVNPSGRTVYALIDGGIVVYDVGAAGRLTRRGVVGVASSALADAAFTPDGANLYVTSRDGRVFQFSLAADGSLAAKAPAAVATGAGTTPKGIAVAPDGSAVYLAAAKGSSGRVIGFAVGAGGALVPAGTATTATGARYLTTTPDGRSLLVTGADGYLFDLAAGPAIAPKVVPSVALSDPLAVLVSPNQPPIASFAAAAQGVAGAPIAFDASGALDPDGTIARYDWDFGDGTILLDGGPTPQHVYAGPGDYVVVLTVTDNEGASTTTIFTGGTALGNGESVAQASRRIQIDAAPAQELRPNLGETLIAEPVRGTVRVRLPGTRRFVPLTDVQELPLGSTIDTTRGRVEVATERRKRGGRVQRARFFGGLFLVRQRRSDRYVTELLLRGELACPSRGRVSTAKSSKKRRVWGNGEGRFRTRGRYSSGAVRGTKWLTEDRCDGTLTVVRRGVVTVRDFAKDKGIILRAGQRYLARPR